ncbi:hypothetical protein PTKIN_Ptkin14bG0159400 [Pterospermum kingtungense]
MLGLGSSGYVNKGRLSNGTNVAMNVFNLQLEGAIRNFDIECEMMSKILHRNIAHLGDFGIAKLLGEDDLMKQTMTLATIGYMAPEFRSAGIVSIKCDLYSYRILLIETFTRKKPIDELFNEAMTMRHWVRSSLSKGVIDIADGELLRTEDEYFIIKTNCISCIMELALECSSELPEERKDMKDVVGALKRIKPNFLNKIEQV